MKIKKTLSKDKLLVFLSGEINEFSEKSLSEFIEGLEHADIVFDLSGIQMINSMGVKVWFNAINSVVRRASSISFIKCPQTFIECCNNYPRFVPKDSIVSFYVPVICKTCQEESVELALVEDTKDGEWSKVPNCKNCNNNMILQVDMIEYCQFR